MGLETARKGTVRDNQGNVDLLKNMREGMVALDCEFRAREAVKLC